MKIFLYFNIIQVVYLIEPLHCFYLVWDAKALLTPARPRRASDCVADDRALFFFFLFMRQIRTVIVIYESVSQYHKTEFIDSIFS